MHEQHLQGLMKNSVDIKKLFGVCLFLNSPEAVAVGGGIQKTQGRHKIGSNVCRKADISKLSSLIDFSNTILNSWSSSTKVLHLNFGQKKKKHLVCH